MKKKKIWIIALAIIAVIVIAIVLLKPKNDNSVSFETDTVKQGNLAQIITATGTVKPINQVDVGTQVSGIIKKIFVDFNSHVKKGQVLAEIDRETLQEELKSAKAQLDAAKIEYTYQQKTFKREKSLHDSKLISDSEFEQAEYNYNKSRTTLSAAKSSYQKIITNLSYTTITSPIDGIVLNRAVEAGQTVAASFSTPTLFTIAQDLSKMEIYANVDEADIGGVSVGQGVTFTVDAYPDITFHGSVKQVRLEATTTSNVVTYSVVINAPNPDGKLKPGLTASVSIDIQNANNIMYVPSKAISFNPESLKLGKDWKINKRSHIGSTCVWVRKDKTLTPIEVKTGLNTGSKIEIQSGLKIGQEIIVGSYDEAQANQNQQQHRGPGIR